MQLEQKSIQSRELSMTTLATTENSQPDQYLMKQQIQGSNLPNVIGTVQNLQNMKCVDTNIQDDFNQVGNHIIAEFIGCSNLNNYHELKSILTKSALAASATILSVKTHQFQPFGMTGVAVLSESHISIHTWPEYGYASVDIYTCGKIEIQKALEELKGFFAPQKVDVVTVTRGFSGKDNFKPETLAKYGSPLMFKQFLKFFWFFLCSIFKLTLCAIKCFKTQSTTGEKFFTELVNHNGLPVTVQITEKCEEKQSMYQKVEVYKTATFGNMIVLDGVVQLTTRDTASYLEMIAHVPLIAHPNPKRVLIIGGGDCGTLTGVVQHKNVEEIVMCEIDAVVVEMAEKYFPQFYQSTKDPRVTLIIQDALQYIKTKQNYFDVIIIDSSDPDGPAQGLFNKPFYIDVYNALTHDGIASAQAEPMFFFSDLIKQMHQQNEGTFKVTKYYYALVPTYPTGSIGFLFSSKKYNELEKINEERINQLQTEYYNREMHEAAFCLPQYMKKVLYE
ncbi:polyamine_aminopropyltransferase [Hexamita inflata]|uniref:Polyamine aminopropyltransferase n=1 Tax=Hexamita inflata TaxID=28002 RepID=A0AA86RCS3_9EUKA|nr:polyamine aminopropyltransferase [Hexamita inflata]